MRQQKQPIPISQLIPDAPPEVLRVHAIADTIKALSRHEGCLDLDNEHRDAVAEELGVPALWIDAATGRDTVTLELLDEWRQWHTRLLGEGKGKA